MYILKFNLYKQNFKKKKEKKIIRDRGDYNSEIISISRTEIGLLFIEL